MPDDDDILDAYEQELDGADLIRPSRASNRGFWMVAITIGLGAIVLMVEIFANRPMVNAISRTENDLKAAMRGAERIYAEGGSFTPADAEALGAVDADRRLRGGGPARGPAGDGERVRVRRHLGRVIAHAVGNVLLDQAGRGAGHHVPGLGRRLHGHARRCRPTESQW